MFEISDSNTSRLSSTDFTKEIIRLNLLSRTRTQVAYRQIDNKVIYPKKINVIGPFRYYCQCRLSSMTTVHNS